MPWINTSPLVKRYTFEEFWEIPDSPDHLKLELIAGVLYMSPHLDRAHGEIVSRLIRLVTEYLRNADNKGNLYFPRAAICRKPNTWVEPDFFYVTADTEAQFDGEYHTTADLVVEVISPESAVYDRNTKADTYAVLGIKRAVAC